MTAVLGEYVRARSKPAVRLLPCLCQERTGRDGSRFLRAGGDLFPNLIHRHLGDPGFRDELFDRLVRAALDQLVGVFLGHPRAKVRSARVALLMSTRFACSLSS